MNFKRLSKRIIAPLLSLIVMINMCMPAYAEENVTAQTDGITTTEAGSGVRQDGEPASTDEGIAPAAAGDTCFEFDAGTGTITGFKPTTGCTGEDHEASAGHTIVRIPEEINGVSVTAIGDRAFDSDEGKVTEVYISGSVTTIGNHAFAGQTELAILQLSRNVTSIGSYAFQSIGTNAVSPLTIVLPDKLQTIGEYAFNGGNIEYVYFNEGLSTIGNRCFAATKLGFIRLPDSLQQIDEAAFAECGLLTDVVFSANTTVITKLMFSRCVNLETITIPQGVENIEDFAFEGCSKLKKIIIPTSVKRVGEAAFSGCTSLNNIQFPSQGNLESLDGHGIFADVPAKEIWLPSTMKDIKGNEGWYLGALNRFPGDVYIPLEKGSIPGNPFGTTNDKVHWLGEFIDFSIEITYPDDHAYAMAEITVTAQKDDFLQYVEISNDYNVYSKVKNPVNEQGLTPDRQHTWTYSYKIEENGVQYLKAAGYNINTERNFEFIVDGIKYAEISANDISIPPAMAESLEASQVLQLSGASARHLYNSQSIDVGRFEVDTNWEELKTVLSEPGRQVVATIHVRATTPVSRKDVWYEKDIIIRSEFMHEIRFVHQKHEGQNEEILLGTAYAVDGGTVEPPQIDWSIVPNHQGWEFDRWDRNLETYKFNRDENVYAFCKEKEYSVKYDLNCENGIAPAPGSYPDKTGVHWTDANLLPTPEPQREHYTFDGWYYDEKLTKKCEANTTFADCADNVDNYKWITLYAKWTPTKYQITYKANYEDTLFEDIKQEFTIESGTISILDNTFERPGYSFTEWNVNPEGQGAEYTEGQQLQINQESIKDLVNLTLYAQWKPLGPEYYVKIPAKIELDESEDPMYAQKTDKVSLVNYRDLEEGIEIFCQPEITLTMETDGEATDSYTVGVFDQQDQKYTDGTTPLMTLDKNGAEANFTLKTAKNEWKKRGVYKGQLVFTFKFENKETVGD